MAIPNETLLTPAGLEQLQQEYDRLVNEWRPQIAERIRIARELGDLKENAEYHDAKNEQGLTESRIRVIEERLRTARVVDDADASVAGVGTSVTVTDLGAGTTEVWHITGVAEADPLEQRVSYESPFGKALMGTKVGDEVTVTIPVGELQLRVEKIEISG